MASLLLTQQARAQAAPGEDENAVTPEVSPSESDSAANPLNLELLLEDPLIGREGFVKLRDQLRQLALKGRTAANFETVAGELATQGIYTTAIELLWFAEQMAPDPGVAAGYRDRMKVWAQASRAADSIVDEADQLFVAGRKPEAIETLLRALEVNPYSERAHYQLADAWRRIYSDEYESKADLPPLDIRVRVFRDAYEHYALALAIDPLFYDAWYGLSELRGLFPDNNEFLALTQPLTQRALDFRGELLPVLQAIEQGKADSETYVGLGAALESLGAFEYAAFAYQCAVNLGGDTFEASDALQKVRNRMTRGSSVPQVGGR